MDDGAVLRAKMVRKKNPRAIGRRVCHMERVRPPEQAILHQAIPTKQELRWLTIKRNLQAIEDETARRMREIKQMED